MTDFKSGGAFLPKTIGKDVFTRFVSSEDLAANIENACAMAARRGEVFEILNQKGDAAVLLSAAKYEWLISRYAELTLSKSKVEGAAE